MGHIYRANKCLKALYTNEADFKHFEGERVTSEYDWPLRVVLKTATWSRESHGLFDYESQHMAKRTMKTKSTRFLVRTGGGEAKLISEPELAQAVAAGVAPLFKIVPIEDQQNESISNSSYDSGHQIQSGKHRH
jgi:hypothetical protein